MFRFGGLKNYFLGGAFFLLIFDISAENLIIPPPTIKTGFSLPNVNPMPPMPNNNDAAVAPIAPKPLNSLSSQTTPVPSVAIKNSLEAPDPKNSLVVESPSNSQNLSLNSVKTDLVISENMLDDLANKEDGSGFDEDFANDIAKVWTKINALTENLKKKSSELDEQFKISSDSLIKFSKANDRKIEGFKLFYEDIKNYFSSLQKRSNGIDSDFKSKMSEMDFAIREFFQKNSKLDQALSDLDSKLSDISVDIKKKNDLQPKILELNNSGLTLKTESISFKKKSDNDKQSLHKQMNDIIATMEKHFSTLQDIVAGVKGKTDIVNSKITDLEAIIKELSEKRTSIEVLIKIISKLKQKESAKEEEDVLKKIKNNKQNSLQSDPETIDSELEEIKKNAEEEVATQDKMLPIKANLEKLGINRSKNPWIAFFQDVVLGSFMFFQKMITFAKKFWHALWLTDNNVNLTVKSDVNLKTVDKVDTVPDFKSNPDVKNEKSQFNKVNAVSEPAALPVPVNTTAPAYQASLGKVMNDIPANKAANPSMPTPNPFMPMIPNAINLPPVPNIPPLPLPLPSPSIAVPPSSQSGQPLVSVIALPPHPPQQSLQTTSTSDKSVEQSLTNESSTNLWQDFKESLLQIWNGLIKLVLVIGKYFKEVYKRL